MNRERKNAGFTLMELLAVIVVLAIVAVIGTTTVLPLLNDTKDEAFATEANEFKGAAYDAISLIILNKMDTANYTKIANGYCFTVKNLIDEGVFDKDDGNYAGTVYATKEAGSNVYKYEVSFSNGDDYYVYKNGGKITTDDLSETQPSGYKATCS